MNEPGDPAAATFRRLRHNLRSKSRHRGRWHDISCAFNCFPVRLHRHSSRYRGAQIREAPWPIMPLSIQRKESKRKGAHVGGLGLMLAIRGASPILEVLIKAGVAAAKQPHLERE